MGDDAKSVKDELLSCDDCGSRERRLHGEEEGGELVWRCEDCRGEADG